MIIIDMGSGETCKNDKAYVKRMIDSLAGVDTGKHRVVIKWQLFTDIWYEKEQRNLISLDRDVFDYAYGYAALWGYETTASVFDKESNNFLSDYVVPFYKIANREDLYCLATEIDTDIIMSVSSKELFFDYDIYGPYNTANYYHKYNSKDRNILCCVSDYPAEKQTYIDRFGPLLHRGMSDHTTDFELYHKYQPEIYEVHYKLEDSTGPDSGAFSRTPEQLSEIL